MYRPSKGTGIRRYEPPSPSYCSEDEKEREEYFVDNPDFEFDELPQPFRFINKILDGLLDKLSIEINKLEELRELESSIKPLPIFKNPSILDLSSVQDKMSSELQSNSESVLQDGYIYDTFKATAASSTIYVASGKQLQAFNCFSKNCLARIEIKSNEYIYMVKVIPIGISESGSALDMVISFDDTGTCFGFLFDGKEFFPVKLFESCASESSKVLKWETCSDLCYLAIIRHESATGNCLEIYRIPRHEWMSEYESAMKKFRTEEMLAGENTLSTNESFEGKIKLTDGIEDHGELEEDREIQSQQQSSNVISYLQLRSMIPVATLKPPRDFTNNTNISTAKPNEGGRIESGNKAMLNASFYKTFRSQLKNDLSGLSAFDENIDLVANESMPTIHFLKGVGAKLVTESKTDHHNCLHDYAGIWWSSRNQFFVYKLPKSSRDGELHLEYAYTNADLIARSCVCEDTSLIAMALQNKNIIIWNRLTAEPSKVLLLEEPGLLFMNFAKLLDSSDSLIFGMKSGNILHLNYSTKDFTFVPLSDQSSIKQSDLLFLEVAPDHPSLLFVAKKPDMITVFDLNQQSAVFHFQLPLGFRLDQSSSECFMLNHSLSMLFVFANKPLQYDHAIHTLYIYNVCISDLWHQGRLPETDGKDLQIIEDSGSKSLESLAITLMRSIHGRKQARKDRQQKRWKEYDTELRNRMLASHDTY